MGTTASRLLKPCAVLMLFLSPAAGADNTAPNDPLTFFIGLSSAGKSTIISSLCDVQLRTSSDMSSTTTVEEMKQRIQCNGRPTHDMVGFGDIPEGENIENANYRGLEKVLSFMEGKNVGQIFFVTSTAYFKDHNDLVKQLTFVKNVLDPRIKWTVIINCFNGVCPSDENTQTEFLQTVSQLIPDIVEVRSPHKQPVDKTMFPIPVTGYPANLPSNWRDLIEDYNIETLRARTTKEAMANCKSHQEAYDAASDKINNHVCSIEACVPTKCQPTACPAAECPNPSCPHPDTCKLNVVEKSSSWFGVMGKSRTESTGVDVDCVDAITTCNIARAESCREHTEHILQCNAQNSEECLKHQASYQICVSQRSMHCDDEKASVIDQWSAVTVEHKPYVQDCQKFYTTHSAK